MLEICTDSLAGVAAAVAGGADRIELCGALELGGLTPSPGVLRRARDIVPPGVALFAMVRPRAGDFAYDRQEIETAIADAHALLAGGAEGLVFGAVRHGTIDATTCETWRSSLERSVPLTFHRAVDLVDDLPAAVPVIAGLGFARILTSGGAATAPHGAETIRAMIARARGRIAIMAGSGVTAQTVPALMRDTGVREVHASASRDFGALDPRVAALGFATKPRRETDVAAVRALRAAIDSVRHGT